MKDKEKLWYKWERLFRSLVKNFRADIFDPDDLYQDAAMIFFNNFETHFNNNETQYINMICSALSKRMMYITRSSLEKNAKEKEGKALFRFVNISPDMINSSVECNAILKISIEEFEGALDTQEKLYYSHIQEGKPIKNIKWSYWEKNLVKKRLKERVREFVAI